MPSGVETPAGFASYQFTYQTGFKQGRRCRVVV